MELLITSSETIIDSDTSNAQTFAVTDTLTLANGDYVKCLDKV